ncbi:hypothetical protein G9F32_11525 [Acinetobacter sp. 194]|uniref:hypothetical protein n=1 Tax=Acinetobacter shaoyimingii TaxID=2715164 RepID=UPI0014072396|nr:hypothetical protein [Acinetobacter shaoyimingii]NHB58639.1 hypothetical protein [Acinetobacter shaoyimingii]
MFLKPTSYDYDFFIKNPRLLNFCFGFIFSIILIVNKNFYFLFFIFFLFISDFYLVRKKNETDLFFIKYKMFSHVLLMAMIYGIALSFAWSLGFLYFILNIFLTIFFSISIGFNAKKNYKKNLKVISDKYQLVVNEGKIDLYEWILNLNVRKSSKFYILFAVLGQIILGFIISGGLGYDNNLHEHLLFILCYILTLMLIYIFPFNYFMPYAFLKSKYS